MITEAAEWCCRVVLQTADTQPDYIGPLLVGLVIAFVGQTVGGWIAIAGLMKTVKNACDDIQELQNLHPRQANPGKRAHVAGEDHHPCGED